MERKRILTMKNVRKRYKKRIAIDDFHLTADEGELIALYGPNGAGKSTIIKMISGVTQPTSGVIKVNGYHLQKHRKQYARNVSYMPDDFQLQQRLTVVEFLQFYANLRGVSQQSVLTSIEQVGLSSKKDDYVSTLSKGMGQRLLLAQVLFSQASLLLLDEPTNGLDDEWLTNLKTILLELKSQKKTVIFSTHLHAFATEIGDRVVRIGE